MSKPDLEETNTKLAAASKAKKAPHQIQGRCRQTIQFPIGIGV